MTQEMPPVEVPPDFTVIGHIIKPVNDASSEAVTARLTDAGIVALSPEARRRHLYILGATGTGKTNLLLRLIESDIANNRAMCVIDLRGDLVDRILLRLAAHAPTEAWRERLLLVDLRDRDSIVSFNPLQGDGDSYNRALHVLDVLRQQYENWGVQVDDTVRSSLIALAESGWSLLEMQPLLMNKSFRAEVLKQVEDDFVHSFFQHYESLATGTQASWASAALNKISPLLAVPELRLLLGQKDTFSFRSLLDQQPGMIILISLAVDRLHHAAHLTGGLFVSAIQCAITSRIDQPESERVPAYLYVDEFEAMAIDRFETIVAEGRRFGLGLTLSHQNISQLSPKMRHVLRNIVNTQVYFQTGALDAAELAKEITGSETREAIKNTLISQGIGEAFLVRRGHPSQRIRTLYSVDPNVGRDVVSELRQESLATYGRKRQEVELELAERRKFLEALSSVGPASAKFVNARHSANASAVAAGQTTVGPPPVGLAPSQSAVPNSGASVAPIYEIRHAKTTHFRPKDMILKGSTPEDSPSTDAASTDAQ